MSRDGRKGGGGSPKGRGLLLAGPTPSHPKGAVKGMDAFLAVQRSRRLLQQGTNAENNRCGDGDDNSDVPPFRVPNKCMK